MVSFVRYQYPEEEIQEVEGDNYELESKYLNTTLWQATGEAQAINPNHPQGKVGWYSSEVFEKKEGEFQALTTANIFGQVVGETWVFGHSACHLDNRFLGQWWKENPFPPGKIQGTALRPTNLRYFSHPRFEPENKTYWYDNLTFSYWHPANGDEEITLKITLQGSQKYSRTELNKKPIFIQIIAGFECPENTCPVLCREKICCYGTDGISVDSFLKEESIY